MSLYWVSEAIPLPITSLIPVIVFPLFEILSTEDVCNVYFGPTIALFLGGFMIADAVEYCGLHRRIALFVILHIGKTLSYLALVLINYSWLLFTFQNEFN